MKPADIIAYGKRKYGKCWNAPFAKAVGCDQSTMYRLEVGLIKKVTPRMEARVKKCIRAQQIQYMEKHAADVKY